MKKITLLISSLVLSTVLVFGQHSRKVNTTNLEQMEQELLQKATRTPGGDIRCFTTEYQKMLKAQFPDMASTEEFEAWIAPKIAEYQANIANGTHKKVVVTIPVIMHIIHNSTEAIGTGRNISQAQATSQITILNNDFRKLNADVSNTPAAFAGLVADLEINFVPALRYASNHPMAGQTLAQPGINRVSAPTITGIANTTTGYSTANVDSKIKPATYWNRTEVMNIWVCQLSGGILGYAQFPSNSTLTGLAASGGAANTDGLVLTYTATGTGGVAAPPFNKGRTATHEIGHWAGLRHIWGDESACGADDYVTDTPQQKGENYGCPTYPQIAQTGGRCNASDPSSMYMNYMDYTDDACMFMFTQGQKARVVTVFANSPGRVELPTSTLGSAAVITSNFTGSPLVINEGQTVTFTNSSTSPNTLNSWNWTFTGGTPSSFSGVTPPAITYSTAGSYSVSLTVTDNAAGNDTKTRTSYVVVNPAGTLICDSTKAGWNWNTEPLIAQYSAYWTQDAAACNRPIEGYIVGNNCYNDNGWASKVTYSGSGKELTNVMYVFDQSTGTGAGSLKVWNANGTGGKPNTVLSSTAITTGQFSGNLNQLIVVPITPAIPLSGSFYIGYDHAVTPLNGDTIAMKLAPGTTGNQTWANETGTGWLDLTAYGVDYKGAVVAIICDIATGVSQHLGEVSTVMVNPNPSTGFINVIMPTETSKFRVAVYNMIGEEVVSDEINSNYAKLDLNNQPNGVYFVKVTANGVITTKKVILSK